MTLTPEQITALDAPLDPKRISQRRDKGIALDYLETYDIIDAANRIFGYDGWGYRLLRLEQVASGTYISDGKEKPWALFEAEVEAWIVDELPFCYRRDVGHGIARPADSVDTLEMQRKGAVSDALKRALRSFGNQFGNSLYDKDHAKPTQAGTPSAARAQGAQGSAPRPLEPASTPSEAQVLEIARNLHQLNEAEAEEFCQDYDIAIETRQDGRHYKKGIKSSIKLTGGQHGTASQLIDELLPLVKGAAKGAPPPTGGTVAPSAPVETATPAPPVPVVATPKPRSKADTDAFMGRISAMLPQFGLTVFDVCEWLQCQPTQVVAKITEWVKAKEGRTVTQLMQQIQADKGAAPPVEPEQAALIEE